MYKNNFLCSFFALNSQNFHLDIAEGKVLVFRADILWILFAVCFTSFSMESGQKNLLV